MHTKTRRFAALAGLAIAASAALVVGPAAAAGTEVVTEPEVTRAAENSPPTDDWMLYTRAGTPASAGAFVSGPPAAPAGTGSLQLTTVAGTEKVQLFNYTHASKPLADVAAISYWTYRSAGSAQQVTSLNVTVDYNGAAAGGFTTLVFEPTYNVAAQGAITTGQWQDWIADGAGIWWSTQPINGQPAGAAVASMRTWTFIVANNPDAVVIAAGLNQGSGNAGLITNVDAFTFDETLYDFELNQPDSDSDGVTDPNDNCPNDANPAQEDTDLDDIGDACDLDDDGDGVADGGDNCSLVSNADQANFDGDSEGDACDSDDDNDGRDDGLDAFPFDPTEQDDTDSDGVGDNADNCVNDANTDQADADGDDLGDVCDADDDNDGYADGSEHENKEQVRDELAALSTANVQDNQRIAKAVERINKSLVDELWEDGDHLDPKKGDKVFQEEAVAVEELLKVKTVDMSTYIARLADIDQNLSQTAIDEATAGAEKNKAIVEQGKGDADLANGKPKQAMEHYRKAWQHAIKAG